MSLIHSEGDEVNHAPGGVGVVPIAHSAPIDLSSRAVIDWRTVRYSAHGSLLRRPSRLGRLLTVYFLSNVILDSGASAVSANGLIVTGQSMTPPDVEAIRWNAKTGMVGLGGLTALPLGFSYALGFGISADGSTIVGQARTVEFEEAFRWTAETGLESIDPLRGTTFFSTARDVSADGSIIVGLGEGLRAMIWDQVHGMRDVQDLLENEHGLDLSGWTLGTVFGVSDDGTHLAGNGFNPNGDQEAWLATLPRTDIPGDLNGDGAVNVIDLLALLAAWGPCPDECPPSCAADLNTDCEVNVPDLLVVLANWG